MLVMTTERTREEGTSTPRVAERDPLQRELEPLLQREEQLRPQREVTQKLKSIRETQSHWHQP